MIRTDYSRIVAAARSESKDSTVAGVSGCLHYGSSSAQMVLVHERAEKWHIDCCSRKFRAKHLSSEQLLVQQAASMIRPARHRRNRLESLRLARLVLALVRYLVSHSHSTSRQALLPLLARYQICWLVSQEPQH